VSDLVEQADFISHEPCPSCGSSDALARYDDGHGFCFSCEKYFPGEDQEEPEAPLIPEGFIAHQPVDLKSRGVRASTCRLAGYGVATLHGQTVQVADYRDAQGNLIAQKVKAPGKKFSVVGQGSKLSCWQLHRFKPGGRRISIFEGETDCLKWLDMFPKYPAVALPSGAAGGAKAIAKDIDFFESFEEVRLCMDRDEAGAKAAEEIAQLFSPGKCRIVMVPEGANDVCDACTKGLQEALVQAWWEAKPYRPDGIVAGDELLTAILEDQGAESLAHYPWEGLNEKLHGIRAGELVTVCAGTGVGKSQFCRSLAVHLLRQGLRVGYIALEEGLARTGLSLLGLFMDKPLHLDRSSVSDDEIREVFDRELKDRLFVYNHFGSMSSENLLARCRYLRVAEKVDVLFIDHLSILVSGWGQGEGDERRLIDNVMTALRSQVCEATGVGMILVSHLRRVDGRAAERGGEIQLSHLRGSQAISQLSDACLALSRDTLGENNNVTQVTVLKNRFSGELGLATHLLWDSETGHHSEVDPQFIPDTNEASQEVPF
jgi:twinkle protein